MPFSDAQVLVLRAMQQALGRDGEAYVTLKEIAERINKIAEAEENKDVNTKKAARHFDEKYVSKLLARLDGKDKIIRVHNFGNRKVFFFDGPQFVTRSETARILMELTKRAVHTSAVLRDDFVKELIALEVFKNSGISKQVINDRLDWAALPTVKYIKTVSDNTIAPAARTYDEWPYLAAIALGNEEPHE